MDIDITTRFLNGLRNNRKHDTFIYYNLFSILQASDPDFLDEINENYKVDNTDYFRMFHKTFRTCDVFDDEKIAAISRVGFTEDERKRRDELLELRRIARREVYIQTMKMDDDAYLKDPVYLSNGKELGVLNQKGNRIILQENRLTGHLDSIFKETISNDRDGGLFDYMTNFLKELNTI